VEEIVEEFCCNQWNKKMLRNKGWTGRVRGVQLGLCQVMAFRKMDAIDINTVPLEGRGNAMIVCVK